MGESDTHAAHHAKPQRQSALYGPHDSAAPKMRNYHDGDHQKHQGEAGTDSAGYMEGIRHDVGYRTDQPFGEKPQITAEG